MPFRVKTIWYLGLPEKVTRAITENFGIGADSLDDSDLDEEGDEDQQDDLEDQNAAIIRFVNEVILKAIVDRELIFTLSHTKKLYRFVTELMASWFQFVCRTI